MASLFKTIFGDNRPINQSSVAIAEREPIYDKMAPKPKYTVQDIHNDFKSAADEIISEAEKLIEMPIHSAIVDKANRLTALGFTASLVIREHSKDIEKENIEIEKAKKLKIQADAARYFSQKYPFNKFITLDKIRDLCQKYKLQQGWVDDYIGDVPEKNLFEIENFKLLPEDSIVCVGINNGSAYPLHDSYYISQTTADSFEIECDVHGIKHIKSLPGHYLKNAFYETNLRIIAPTSDFLKSNERVVRGEIVEVKDPIVLQPVFYEGLEDIYLIVTAWGDEASDPDVVNVKMN